MAILPELLISAAVLQNILVGKDGLPLAAGVVTLYHDNDRQLLKNWYYQSGTPGNYTWIALPNPMTLSAAGTTEDANGNDIDPFYYPWLLDPSTGQEIYDPYFITVYNSNGQLQFTRAFFPFNGDEVNPNPPTQDIYTLENQVFNNRFWRNIGSVNAGTIPLPAPYNSGIGYIQNGNFLTAYNSSGNYYYVTLAPSQNDGFSMPDFNYIKNAQGGVESISFLKFPATIEPPLGGDVTPEFYIEHICGTQDTGVSIKVYQFPISLHLATLAGQTASMSIQARSNTGGTQLTLSLYQFQGTGNTSIQGTPIGVFPLNTTWHKWNSVTFTIPSNVNVVPSSTGDDAWYLQIGMPVTTTPFEIDFTLPSLYLNPAAEIPTNSFESYDVVDTIISKPRTGDIRIGVNNFYPYGWVPMNNGTIGNTTATPFAPTARNNIDTWPLFNLIWNLFAAYSTGTPTAGLNPIAPMYLTGAAATQVGYGPNVTPPTTALSDWNAGNQLSLTQSMGRVMMGTVPLVALINQYTSTFTAAQLSSVITASNDTGSLQINISGTFPISFGEVVRFTTTGTLPAGLALATNYYITPLSSTAFNVSTSLANAQAGVYVIWTNAGTGIHTTQSFSLVLTSTNPLSLFTGMPLVFTNTGGALPTGLVANTLYYASVSSVTTFSVATSFLNAIQGDLIGFIDVGSGTNTVYSSPGGSVEGEYNHKQLIAELATHNHTGSGTTPLPMALGTAMDPGGGAGLRSSGSNAVAISINNTGNSVPANVSQPSVFQNIYIKL